MLDRDAKRTVLRSFTYGLYAVSAAHGEERGIFTANWLSQISFDPPLVALSVERDSSTLGLIRHSGRFVIAPLKAGARDMAGNLGRPRARVGDKFSAYDLEIITTASGDPTIADSLGYVVCKTLSESPAGDSVLLIGEVIEACAFEEVEPLRMHDAGFRHFG